MLKLGQTLEYLYEIFSIDQNLKNWTTFSFTNGAKSSKQNQPFDIEDLVIAVIHTIVYLNIYS